MLSGEPRSASIRTATKTTLLRLQRKVLLNLMAAHPPMHDAISGAFAHRRGRNSATAAVVNAARPGFDPNC